MPIDTEHIMNVYEFLGEDGRYGLRIGRVEKAIPFDICIFSDCPPERLEVGSAVLYRPCSKHNLGMLNVFPMIEALPESSNGPHFSDNGIVIGVPQECILDFLDWH